MYSTNNNHNDNENINFVKVNIHRTGFSTCSSVKTYNRKSINKKSTIANNSNSMGFINNNSSNNNNSKNNSKNNSRNNSNPKVFNQFKSKESLRINGNKNKKTILDNFQNGDFFCTFTKFFKKDRMISNVHNFDFDNHEELNEIIKKDAKLLEKNLFLIFRSMHLTIDYLYINVDFSTNGDVHYHTLFRLRENYKTVTNKIINKKSKKINLGFIKLLNSFFKKLGFTPYIERVYNVSGIANYITHKMIGCFQDECEVMKDVFKHIPNFTKMQHDFGDKWGDIDLEIDICSFIDLVDPYLEYRTFYKTYCFYNEYGHLLNKTTRSYYSMGREKMLELFKDYIKEDIV